MHLLEDQALVLNSSSLMDKQVISSKMGWFFFRFVSLTENCLIHQILFLL